MLATIILIAFLTILYIAIKHDKKREIKKYYNNEKTDLKKEEIQTAYQSKWMFTYNEKDAYKKLKETAEKSGYTVFAKVRLLDLVEPIKGNQRYKAFLWKIQAKHVDFVLCDNKLIAKKVIELDDNSHTQEDRKERDNFIDTVLESCGYKVLHTRNIIEEEIIKFINEN